MFVRTRRMSSERFGYFEKLTSTKIINTRGYFPLNKNKNNYNALSFKSHHRHVKRFKSSTSRHRPAVSAATHVLSEQFLTCSRNKLPLAAICLSPIDKLSAWAATDLLSVWALTDKLSAWAATDLPTVWAPTDKLSTWAATDLISDPPPLISYLLEPPLTWYVTRHTHVVFQWRPEPRCLCQSIRPMPHSVACLFTVSVSLLHRAICYLAAPAVVIFQRAEAVRISSLPSDMPSCWHGVGGIVSHS
jgi:hypothetical protein